MRRLHLMGLMLLLTVCIGCASDTRIEALGQARSLTPFFAALNAAQHHQGGPVTILQIGDSHTANDGFSGRMRQLLQSRFGAAGRGMLQAGIPFRSYNPQGVTVTAQGWQTISSMTAQVAGPFGLSGLRQHATAPADMTLASADDNPLGVVTIEALGQPNGGVLEISVDGGPFEPFDTNRPALMPVWHSVQASRSLTIRTPGGRPVDLLSWSSQRNQAGVTYANLGTIGATVNLMKRWDPALVQAEMSHLRPTLVVVAFGTNEGFRDKLDLAAYKADYAARLAMLRRAAPRAAFMIVGPPDGTRRAPAGTSGQAGTFGQAGSGNACPQDPAWQTPPYLAGVRDAQRQVARQEDLYFWDWSSAMGGACAITRWARLDPPIAAPDHVHLLRTGYRLTAERLFNDLMRSYGRYSAGASAR